MELFKDCSQLKLEELKRVKKAFELKGKIVSAKYMHKESEDDEVIHVTTTVEGSGFERHIYKSHKNIELKDLEKLTEVMASIISIVNEEGGILIYLHSTPNNASFIYHDNETDKCWCVYNDVDFVVAENMLNMTENMINLMKEIGDFSKFLLKLNLQKANEILNNIK